MNPIPPDRTVAARAKSSGGVRLVRRFIPYVGGVALVALIAAGFWPQPAPVETARATLGTLRTTVNEEGKTRIKQRFIISSPIAGQLRRIVLKPGAEVKSGKTVAALIDPITPSLLDARSRTLAEARRDAAVANLEKARATHEFAAKELRRFEKLFAEKAVASQEFESVRLREISAANEMEAAQSNLRQAEAELAEFTLGGGGVAGSNTNAIRKSTEVKSPASGKVLRVFEESSRVVASGVALMEIGDGTDLEVVIEVLSRDGAAIAQGTKVELDQWGGGHPLEARVRLVEPAAFTKVSALGVEEQRVNVIADLITPPDQRRGLGDNFRVEARIIIWETTQTLKVPSGALFRNGEQWATFVVADGRVRLRPVKVGRSSGTETQILDGLKEGEDVILYPGDRVHDGDRVRPIKI